MKIIFLDIDGVLNTYYTKVKVAGFTFVEDDLVAMLRQLIDRTGAQVVLSSTWREGWDMQVHPEEYPDSFDDVIALFNALKDKLHEYDIELLDYTPIFGMRGQEIDKWLKEKAPEPVDAYVVLDDLDGRYLRPHSRYFVETSMSHGLLQHHVDRAVKILNGEEDAP